MVNCKNCIYYTNYIACETYVDWCDFANEEIPEVSTGKCDFYVNVDSDDSKE